MPMKELPDLLEAFPPVPTAEWEAAIRADLRGADYEKALLWRTREGFSLRPFYRAEDLADLGHAPASLAGLRGSSGDRPNAWGVREDLSAPSAETLREAHEGGASDIGLPAAAFPSIGSALDARQVRLHLTGTPDPGVLESLLTAARGGLRGSLDEDPFARLARGRPVDVQAAVAARAPFLGAGIAPGFYALTVATTPYHEAGATLVMETGAVLAAAKAWFDRLLDLGLSPEACLPSLQFRVEVGPSYFLEIARLRSLRLLWPQLCRAYVPDADPPPPYIQAVTSGFWQTVYDPHTNLLRATTAAAAAVIGGCDVLRVRPFDAPLATQGTAGRRLARNVQLLLQHEAGLGQVCDPGAGAYYLEHATDRIARGAWGFFQEIEAQGGLEAALRGGFLSSRLAASRTALTDDLNKRRRVLVGTNRYPDLTERRLDDAPLPAGTPPGAPTDLPAGRAAEGFEALRLRTERHARQAGRFPSVFLLPIGPAALRTARATFSADFFGCAGFTVTDPGGFDDLDAAVAALRAALPDVVVLCSADEAYAELVPHLVGALGRKGPSPLLVVAGNPEGAGDLEAAGVDAFIHRGSPIFETLLHFQDRLGLTA